jgi:Skp family chaperone for outer membrane proteins
MIAKLGSKLLGLSGPVLAWAAVAAGTVIAGLIVVVAVQARSIQSKSEDIGQAKAHTRAAIQAAVNNEQAVLDVTARLRACVTERKASIEAERKANAALERRQAEIDQATDDERGERDEIYSSDQDCDAWRLALVCDGIADRLRFHSARSLGADRRSSGPGADRRAGGPD